MRWACYWWILSRNITFLHGNKNIIFAYLWSEQYRMQCSLHWTHFRIVYIFRELDLSQCMLMFDIQYKNINKKYKKLDRFNKNNGNFKFVQNWRKKVWTVHNDLRTKLDIKINRNKQHSITDMHIVVLEDIFGENKRQEPYLQIKKCVEPVADTMFHSYLCYRTSYI